MKVGFTGTRQGMTEEQLVELKLLLLRYAECGSFAYHGDCVGSDAEFNEAALYYGYHTFGYPASDVPEKNRAHCMCTTVMSPKPALTRNRIIVDCSDVMIACPKSYEEEWRGSGTWAAIRYAKKVSKPLYVIYPNGTIDKLNGAE